MVNSEIIKQLANSLLIINGKQNVLGALKSTISSPKFVLVSQTQIQKTKVYPGFQNPHEASKISFDVQKSLPTSKINTFTLNTLCRPEDNTGCVSLYT
jgi:ribosomal protein L13